MSRLLLVGWDAADWKIIDPLIQAGEMPNLARLISQGVRGNHATLHPPLSPMLWTSIATGKRPPLHGIHGFTEPTPDGLKVRPISNMGRKTKAIWNILHQNGKKSIVVGWWPSHPAEPIRGAMVSDHFPLKGPDRPQQRMPAGAVYPPSLAERLHDMRVHPTEVDSDILNLFIPGWAAIDQKTDRSVHDLAQIIAETMSIHGAATELMEHETWDFAAIYYVGIDHFSHRFMRYLAGKRIPRSQGSEPALFTEVVRNAYRYHDVMLGRLLQLAGDDCAVMVISDHGFHSDALLPDYIPAEAAGPATEHRNFGIFCMRGPGVRVGERIYGASLLDVAPTALHVMGIPAGRDMQGKVLLNAFNDGRPVETIESWDLVEGDAGRHPPGEEYNSEDAAESFQHLVALGYVDPPSEDARDAVGECVREQRYNLARAWIDGGNPEMAEPILRELIAKYPEEARFYFTIAGALLQMDNLSGAEKVLDDLDQVCNEFAPRARAELKEREAKAKNEPLEDQKDPKAKREQFERRKLFEKAMGYVPDRLLWRCRLALISSRRSKRREKARELLEQLAKVRRPGIPLRLFLAQGFAAVKEYSRALKLVAQVRRADPDNAEAMGLAARIHFAEKRFEDAVECAVDALALVYMQPDLHHLLGLSLVKLDQPEKAEQAFRTVLALAPRYAPSMEALGRLISHDRKRIGEGSLLMATAAKLRETNQTRRAAKKAPAAPAAAPVSTPARPGLTPFERASEAPPADRSRVITIVAGLPRTGTSMMMQMLAEAGLEPFTDAKRQADSDNPRGYFEHAKATQLHKDASWIPEARGKAVKIVAHLLPYLPPGEEYRLVFMHRNLQEVVDSQSAMLERLGKKGAALSAARLIQTYTQQLVQVQTWLKRQANIAVMSVNYADAVKNPAAIAERLGTFLGEPFDVRKATKVVEPSLQRQKAAKLGS